MLKKILLSVGVLVLIAAGFVYAVFLGTPWGKWQAVNTLTPYVEEKYNIEVIKKKGSYNFKDGNYGAVFTTKEGYTFRAEIINKKEKTYFDYYPESVWKKELETEMKSHVEELFPNRQSDYFDGVYGISNDLGIKGEIPSFKDVNSHFIVSVRLDEKYSEALAKENDEKFYKLVQVLREKGINNVELSLYYGEGEGKEWHGIVIPPDKMEEIQTAADIEKFHFAEGEKK